MMNEEKNNNNGEVIIGTTQICSMQPFEGQRQLMIRPNGV